jgi:hypothetical protein
MDGVHYVVCVACVSVCLCVCQCASGVWRVCGGVCEPSLPPRKPRVFEVPHCSWDQKDRF